MGKKKTDKVDVTGESFVSSPEQVAAACAADDAEQQHEESGEPGAESTEETEQAPDDGVFTDEGASAAEVEETAQEPKPYVTRDPDFIGATFVRDMPVPVPAEEMAEHAKEQARLYGVREKAIADKKASTAGFNRLIKDTEHRLLEVSNIVEMGTEERPTVCRWEFDYTTGVKKLRRLDTHQIAGEETLTAEERQPSLFNQQAQESEAAVEQLRAVQGEAVEHTPLTDDPDEEPPVDGPCEVCGNPVTTEENVGHECNLHPGCVSTESEEPPKERGPHACKLCGFDTDNHVYLVRHLRDIHAMKLSEYKAQFPAQQ